ncbi:UNVERIFIED_CONTAM: LOB domain-containing protein 15 [Sesamum latifolium]|uniref:LOB domain-containing protein 15 n=1 Tax=Sesamum latifolium TaxID=2727402 RepID=A0AAW2Y0R8_9LAMI
MPLFPLLLPSRTQKFAAVHKVFGASNVSKMLMEVPAPQRADAANSLVYEANVRLRDPVYGCMGAISALQQQVQTLQAELNAVRADILRYRYREAANSIIASTNAALAVSVAELPQAPPTPPLLRLLRCHLHQHRRHHLLLLFRRLLRLLLCIHLLLVQLATAAFLITIYPTLINIVHDIMWFCSTLFFPPHPSFFFFHK